MNQNHETGGTPASGNRSGGGTPGNPASGNHSNRGSAVERARALLRRAKHLGNAQSAALALALAAIAFAGGIPVLAENSKAAAPVREEREDGFNTAAAYQELLDIDTGAADVADLFTADTETNEVSSEEAGADTAGTDVSGTNAADVNANNADAAGTDISGTDAVGTDTDTGSVSSVAGSASGPMVTDPGPELTEDDLTYFVTAVAGGTSGSRTDRNNDTASPEDGAEPETASDAGSVSGTKADTGTEAGTRPGTDTESESDTDAGTESDTPENAVEEPEPVDESIAGPDNKETDTALTRAEQKDAKKLDGLASRVTVEADTLESVTFAEIEQRTREKNLTVQGLIENITSLEDLDYEDMEDSIRDGLSDIGFAIQMTELSYSMAGEPLAGTMAAASLENSYDSLYESLKNLRDGKTQRDNRALERQLKNAVDQLVMGSENLYIALTAMDIQKGALERQVTALNRTVEELELRYSLGQIPELTLRETKAGRTALVSGMETLNMTIRTYTMQLENLLGAAPTGELRIGALPAVTEKQISAMDVEADLSAAKAASYELYAAARTLQDAQEAYGENPALRLRNSDAAKAATHTWAAAQDTYNAALRSYELRFRTLYEQVKDYYQVWNAAKAAEDSQNASYQAAELKYNQGNLSKNALLTAQDELTTAREKTKSAANDLFSAYNNYCWAVQQGILN